MSATVGVLRRPGDAPNGPTRPVALSSLELDGEVKVQGIEITRKDKVFKTGRVKIHYLANRLVLEVSYRSGGAPHVFDIKKEGIGVQCVNQSNIWFKSTDQGICVCYRTTGKASMEPFRAQIDKMIAASDKMEASAPSSGFVAASDFLNASEAYSPRLPSIKSQYPSSSRQELLNAEGCSRQVLLNTDYENINPELSPHRTVVLTPFELGFCAERALRTIREDTIQRPTRAKVGCLDLPSEPIRYLILSDSIHRHVSEEMLGERCLVRAIGGCDVRIMTRKLRRCLQLEVDHVCLTIGINDVLESSAIYHIITNYTSLVRLILKTFSPKHLTLCSLLPLSGSRTHLNQRVLTFNLQLARLCQELDAENCHSWFLDLHSLFSESIDRYLSTDGLHPSPLGKSLLQTAQQTQFNFVSVYGGLMS